MVNINKKFWLNKKVLITGATGFKGSWLSLWLTSLGSRVVGYSLNPITTPSLFKVLSLENNIKNYYCDIRDLDKLRSVVSSFQPDIVFHMAAQPLVRYSYNHPIETYQVNVIGTANILEACKNCDSIQSIINITTDKCYENREWEFAYKEDDPMGGYDPYSSSKGCSELVTSAYRRSFFDSMKNSHFLASARAGNVIGGGDWSLDRLIPDALKAFEKGEKVYVRNPNAIRPWQHVLEPLRGYLMLAEKLFENGKEFSQAWNFGPIDDDCKSVEYVMNKLCESWSENVNWVTDSTLNPHEANLLKLDCSKAKKLLKWKPKINLDSAIIKIVEWHDCYLSNNNIKEFSLKQIKDYLK